MERLDSRGGRAGFASRGARRGESRPVAGRGSAKPVQKQRLAKTQAKKYQEKAKISSLITLNKSYAMKRILRDLNEITSQVTPIVGVTAHPLDSDIFTWHANIKASSTSVYKGAVLHFVFNFPANYPVSPPEIKVLNANVIHPNIVNPGGIVCLDILEKKYERFRGWTSAYTVLSILIQLQSFFCEADEAYLDEETKKKCAAAAREMNEFNCTDPECKHKGSANPWPEFIKGDYEVKNHIMTHSSYIQALKREIVCYHRKTGFEETPLGLGVNILKIPRTGEINSIVPTLDFVSLKAYTKEKLRVSMSNQRFTHWFPLYFGTKDEQFLKLCTRAISMINYGNTKNFAPELIVKIMPKFFNAFVADIMNEKTYNSCKTLKMLIHVFRVFLYLVKTYPQTLDAFEQKIFNFISDPALRIKDQTPSLGELLTFVLISKKYKIEDLLVAYVDEQLDRQIFWIIQLLPDLESLLTSSSIDDVKSKVCFKAGIVGNQILLFYHYFIKKIIFKDVNSHDDIATRLDSNYGNITEDEITNHQKEILKILKIDSYADYYKFLGLTPPTDNEMNERISTAYKNSLTKGYHGSDLLRFVPSNSEQINKYFEKFPKLKELKNEKGEFLEGGDKIWEDLVIQKFEQVTKLKLIESDSQLTPYQIVSFLESRKNDFIATSYPHEFDKKSRFFMKPNSFEYQVKRVDEDLLKSLDWRTLYFKLYLENYLKYFRYIGDFKELYDVLDQIQGFIEHFNFYIYSSEDLKSDYNYVRVVFSKLSKLKHLNIYFLESGSLKLIKNILKGVSNFINIGGLLENIGVYVPSGVYVHSHKDFNILTMIDKFNHLKSLDLSNTTLDHNSALRIRNHLYYFKTIENLILNNCGIVDEMAKEIADGIMKAKSLESISLRGNKMVNGLSSILYNLAFQPSLKLLDISENSSLNIKDTAISLYKLIKMSQSLETLIFRSVNNLIQEFAVTNDFYYSLGDNSSLRHIDFSYSGVFTEASIKNLAIALAFNHLKNGALETIDISNTGISYHFFNSFVENMFISEENHVKWYGTNFNTAIVKDSKEYFEKKFYCKIKNLIMNGSNFVTTININDLKLKPKNNLSFLLSNNLNIETFSISNSSINKNFIEILSAALNNKNSVKTLLMRSSNFNGEFVKQFFGNIIKNDVINPNFNIEYLDISKNKFGYSGIEAVSKFLTLDKKLKSLNLYYNFFDVDGARSLSKALQVNTTLENLDIGYNRIKDLGFITIAESLISNKSSNIKYLSVRYNLIKNKMNNFVNSLDKVLNSTTSLQKIELSNNLLDDKTVNYIYSTIYSKSNKNIKLDIFEVLFYLSQERLERTVWISPLNYGVSKVTILNAIKDADADSIVTDSSNLGIPLAIKLIRPRKMGEKKDSKTCDAFIEFIHPNSANRMLKIAASLGFLVEGKKMRVYKAGTRPERFIVKKKKN